MKPVKPEDKPKVIALGAATLVMFGYVGVSFARSKSGSAAPTPSPSPTGAATPGSGTSATSPSSAPLPGNATARQTSVPTGKMPTTEQEVEAGAARQKIVLPNLTSDPFQPVVAHKSVEGAAAGGAVVSVLPPPLGVPKSNATSTTSLTPFTPPVVPGTALPGVAANPTPPMNTGNLSVVPLELPLKLNGVITGSAGNVALVQVGEGEQFVNVGDILLRWRVLRIGIDTVTLRRGNQVRVLRVGAGNNESDAVTVAPASKVAKAPRAIPTPIAVLASPPNPPVPATPPASPTPSVVAPGLPPTSSELIPMPQAPTPQSTPASPVPSPAPATPTPLPAGTPLPVVG